MSFHLYRINELYSNADGLIQFIEMTIGNENDEGFWAGQPISVSQNGTTHTFSFPSHLPNQATANTKVLIATQGFANLGVVAPDFIIPAGFLFLDGGTVNFAGADAVSYIELPTGGSTSLNRSGSAGAASPTNFAGATATLAFVGGGNGNDTLRGTAGDDSLQGAAGNDTIDGGAGTDIALFGRNLAGYTVARSGGTYTVETATGTDGTDILTNVESLRFADKTVNLTVQALAAAAPQADVQRLAELYVAFFNRVPDADGLAYWIGQMGAGQGTSQIAEAFYNAGVQYSSLTGFSATMSNADFINVIYHNVLGRSEGADADGLAYWSGELASGRATHGSLVSTILSSAHTFKGDPTWGWVADLLDNKITVAKTFAVDWGLNYNSAADSITQGMAIAAAVTHTSTAEAIALIGVAAGDMHLL